MLTKDAEAAAVVTPRCHPILVSTGHDAFSHSL